MSNSASNEHPSGKGSANGDAVDAPFPKSDSAEVARFLAQTVGYETNPSGSSTPNEPGTGSGSSFVDLAQTGVYDSNTPSTPAASKGRQRAPRSVGGYTLGEMLGQGGMGRVYKAEDSSGRLVALKLLSPDLARSDDALARFKQEGLIASQINHPHCVFVHRVDEDAGTPFIAMELMTGQTLKDVVLSRGPLPYPEAVGMILQCMEGLTEAHSRGMIHRDIKPANCYLDDEGNIKVGDFGLARSLVSDSELTQTGAFLGTPLFASPEQLLGQSIDARSDIYSLTATLYYLLAGKAPFESPHAAQVIARIASSDPPKLESAGVQVPFALEQIVLKGLAREPSKRYESIAQMRADLLNFMAPKAEPASLPRRALAGIADMFVLSLLVGIVIFAVVSIHVLREKHWLPNLVGLVVVILYYLILEGVFATSPGKAAMRIRVVDKATGERPGFLSLCTRVFSYAALTSLLDVIYNLLVVHHNQMRDSIVSQCLTVLGIGLVCASWRATGKRQLLHDWLSNTECRFEQSLRRNVYVTLNLPSRDSNSNEANLSPAIPSTLGRFEIIGAVDSTQIGSAFCWLRGRDPQLERDVWLAYLQDASIEFEAIQSNKPKSMCMRFIEEGTHGGHRWFAYVAPEGTPLRQCLESGIHFPWPITRTILGQLANENTLGSTTMASASMSQRDWDIDRLWIDRSGRLSLVDRTLEGMLSSSESNQDYQSEFLKSISRLSLPPSHPSRRIHITNPQPQPVLEVESLPPLRAERWLASIAGNRYMPVASELESEIRKLDQAAHNVTNRMRFFNSALSLAFLIPIAFSIFIILAMASIASLLIVRKEVQQLKSLVEFSTYPEKYPVAWKDESEESKSLWTSQAKRDLLASLLEKRKSDLSRAYSNLSTTEKMILNAIASKRDQIVDPPVYTVSLDESSEEKKTLSQELSSIESELEDPNFETRNIRIGGIDLEGARWNKDRMGEIIRAAEKAEIGESEEREFHEQFPAGSICLVLLSTLLAWTAITFGGMCQYFTGVCLFRRDGRRLSLFRSVWRATLMYAPLLLFTYGAAYFIDLGVDYSWWATQAKRALTAMPFLYLIATLIWSGVTPLDRLANTAMVPR